jgi:hypothetical protein
MTLATNVDFLIVSMRKVAWVAANLASWRRGPLGGVPRPRCARSGRAALSAVLVDEQPAERLCAFGRVEVALTGGDDRAFHEEVP